MPGRSRLVIDRFSEVFDVLETHATEHFYDFAQVESVAGTVYVIGRQNLLDNMQKFRDMAESGLYTMIFCNAAEGSWTLESQIRQLHIDDLIRNGKAWLIGGACVDPAYRCIDFDHFLVKILDFEENLRAQQCSQHIYDKPIKPYKFLFLNGRARPHRKYLYEKLRRSGALAHSLFTMLDTKPTRGTYFHFWEDDIDVMSTISAITLLPATYEVERYRNPVFGPIVPGRSNIKQELFHQEWGEIYLEPAAYIDTYFSLITETVCAESICSFRTEKIAKPLAMAHPFVVAATPGFYRDLRSLGFRTFGHVIDESFDSIENVQDRMDRIIDIVDDLCKQDLASFLATCQDVCKYNQQHLAEFADQTKRDFPQKFFRFLDQHG